MIAVETAVVGGGPAGAATACSLAASGREVMLLERASEPKHKVCGEFLSIDTQAHLALLGVDPVEIGAVPIDYVSVYSGERRIRSPLPFRALSLSRFRLDHALLQRAGIHGAKVGRGIAVQAARRQGATWQLKCDNQETVCCRHLVVATGKVGLRGIADMRDGSSVGLKVHFKPSANVGRTLDRHVELFLLNEGYAGLELVEDGVANLCLAMPRAAVARLHPGFPQLQEYLAAASPVLAARLEGATPLWKKPLSVVFPAGGYLHAEMAPADSAAYRVGDRLAHIPPFTGDGIAIALSSAALAAEHIRQGRPASSYLAAARRLTGTTIRLAGAVSCLAGSSIGRAVLTAAASHVPTFLQTIVQWTRVPAQSCREREPAK